MANQHDKVALTK